MEKTNSDILDAWIYIIGLDVFMLYIVYCRLAEDGEVNNVSQERLAKLLRLGISTLRKKNSILRDCGFISIRTPRGREKLLHDVSTIKIFSPPTQIEPRILQKYCPKGINGEPIYENLSSLFNSVDKILEPEIDEPSTALALTTDLSITSQKQIAELGIRGMLIKNFTNFFKAFDYVPDKRCLETFVKELENLMERGKLNFEFQLYPAMKQTAADLKTSVNDVKKLWLSHILHYLECFNNYKKLIVFINARTFGLCNFGREAKGASEITASYLDTEKADMIEIERCFNWIVETKTGHDPSLTSVMKLFAGFNLREDLPTKNGFKTINEKKEEELRARTYEENADRIITRLREKGVN